MNPLSDARRLRLHRTSAAQVLASLQSSCSLDDLAEIDWQSLTQVPHWCFVERVQRDRLQLVCGVVYLAPQMVRWFDSSRLLQARALIGDSGFDAAIRAGVNRPASPEFPLPDAVPEALATAGASVLTGAVEHAVIARLLAEQFPVQIADIEQTVAKAVYDLSLVVIDTAEFEQDR